MSVTKCLRRKKVKKKKAASSYPIGIFLCLEKYDDGCRERVCSRGDTVNALPRSRSNRICHVTRGRRRRKKEKGRSGCAIVSRWKWFANIILKRQKEHLISVGARAHGETHAAACCVIISRHRKNNRRLSQDDEETSAWFLCCCSFFVERDIPDITSVVWERSGPDCFNWTLLLLLRRRPAQKEINQ